MKPRVIIDRRMSFVNAFTDPRICLFLPVNVDGVVVEAHKAVVLLAYAQHHPSNSGLKPYATEPFAEESAGISNALLRLGSMGPYAPLAQSVAFGSLRVMNKWLSSMRRQEDMDILDVDVHYYTLCRRGETRLPIDYTPGGGQG